MVNGATATRPERTPSVSLASSVAMSRQSQVCRLISACMLSAFACSGAVARTAS